jgi:hypothetical protein
MSDQPKIDGLSHEDIERLIDLGIRRAFATLGIDAKEPLQVQQDLAFVRNLRKTTEQLKRQGLISAFVLILTAVLGLIWIGLKLSLKSSH